jgi:hypothetical protein
VLIAQLATTAGARAPLAHTANRVFLDLTRELKQQGLGSKVISDMFGLERAGTTTYSTSGCVIPLGSSSGWEAAVFDRYQALVTDIFVGQAVIGLEEEGSDE